MSSVHTTGFGEKNEAEDEEKVLELINHEMGNDEARHVESSVNSENEMIMTTI